MENGWATTAAAKTLITAWNVSGNMADSLAVSVAATFGGEDDSGDEQSGVFHGACRDGTKMSLRGPLPAFPPDGNARENDE